MLRCCRRCDTFIASPAQGLNDVALLRDAGQAPLALRLQQGLRRSLDLRSEASRAEFWAYLSFFTLAWALTRLAWRPWDLAVTVALGLPLLSLAWRRWHSLHTDEQVMLAATAAAILPEVMLGR